MLQWMDLSPAGPAVPHLRIANLIKATLVALLASPAWAAAQPPVLRVAVGENKPPYVMENDRRGIEVELVTRILKDAGYSVQMNFLPNRRAQALLEAGALDAAISDHGPFVSEPYIVYQNVALTLCRNHIALRTVGDLAGRRIAAFQNARLFLGSGFGAMAAGNPDYREPPQASINRLLYANAVDVGVGDINIFYSMNAELGLGRGADDALCPYALFPPTSYRLAFRKREARDRFNTALQRALQGQAYEALARRYDMPLSLGHPYFKPSPVPRRPPSLMLRESADTRK